MLGNKVYRKDKSSVVITQEGSGLYYYSNLPKLYIKDESIKINNIDSNLFLVLQKLNSIAFQFGLKGFIITSGNDGQHGGSNGSNSLHYKNRAIDLSFREAISNRIISGIKVSSSILHQQIQSTLNNKLETLDFDVIIESNHIHIEYDPKQRNYVTKQGFLPKVVKESQERSKSKPIKYIHTDLKITTIDQLLEGVNLFSKYKTEKEKLLGYKGETSLTNRERLESLYGEDDQPETIKPNSILFLDPEMIDRDFIFKGSKKQVIDITSFPMFFGKKREELESNPDYMPSELYQSTNDYPVEYINHLVSVWVYSKALGEIIDITSLCSSVTVVSDQSISTFSLVCNISPVIEGGIIVNIFDNNMSYIQRILTENDLIWIRFESLKGEDRDLKENISFSELAGKVYDFMGFVSLILPELTLGKATGVVNVSGQCFSKLFTNDEALFLPLSTVKDSVTGNLVIGQFENDNLLKRLFSDGKFYTLFSIQYRTIQDSILFYINQLSNTGLIPERDNEIIFQSYKDRRKEVYKIKGDSVQSSLVKGVYQIIDVLFDKSVGDRTIVDSTIASPSGSIMSLLQKICQQPLVEMMTDTYGDMYNIIVRKPPFDKESIKSFLQKESNIYSLAKDDVSFENLSFENEFYTWFQIENNGVFFGDSKSISLTYIPIIPLNEYIEYWGSKKRMVSSNYTRSNNYGSVEEKKQVVLDLLYVLECDIYLPFSRKGIIVLAKGDRRIKKGSWIRYGDEVFYINSVTNSVSISGTSVSRVTSLNVSRGLKEEFIEGKIIDGKKYSYFDIVNFEGLKQTMLEFLTNEKDRGSVINRNVIVDKDIFDFFIKKRQFNG